MVKTSFFVLFWLVALGGCATLPDVERLMRDFPYGSDGQMTGNSHGLPPDEGRTRNRSACQSLDPPDEAIERNARVVAAVGGTPLFCGNKATLLIDGKETFAAMLDAIDKAKEHVNIETYMIEDDPMGRRFADLLLKKHAEGVTINLIYDPLGCRRTPESFFLRLREGGVNVLEFNPVALGRLWGPNAFYHRTHRKVLIVDGEVAFTGGLNIGLAYTKSRPRRDRTSPPSDFWRDTHVMIEGPAVAAFQELFLHTWQEQAGAPPPDMCYFPPVAITGDQMVQVADSTPGYAHRGTYVMYVSAIARAKQSVHIIQSYFAPDEQMMKALVDAAKRGLDVKIILPRYSDHGCVRQAGRKRYQELLDAGVKLYEQTGAILHSKTAVIDGVWSTVGSTNFDLWSFCTSDEVNAVVIGRAFGDRMEESFKQDMEQSTPIPPEGWRDRSLFNRASEFFCSLFSYWF